MRRVLIGLLSLMLAAAPGAWAQAGKSPATAKTVTKAKAKTAAQPAAKAGAARNKAKAVARQAPRSTKRRAVKRALPPRPPSIGHLTGLQKVDDPLDLKSSVALVIDGDTDQVLFSKNPEAVLPIASITKLMTALVVTEAGLPLEETLVVTAQDVGATSGSRARSRLRAGTELSRGEMLHLALMSSENRAAYVLGRTYPGGINAFIQAMNAKAHLLGMHDTRYVEPTGLSSDNRSSAQDLALLVRAAADHPIIRDLSTSPGAVVPVGRQQLQFNTTNGLVRSPEWDIAVQKTGYISAAGRCLVMQAQVAGRNLIMVLLDSAGKYSRIGDAERIRKWLASAPFVPSAMAAPVPIQPLPAPRLMPPMPTVLTMQRLGIGATVAPALPAPGAVLQGPLVKPVALPAGAQPL